MDGAIKKLGFSQSMQKICKKYTLVLPALVTSRVTRTGKTHFVCLVMSQGQVKPEYTFCIFFAYFGKIQVFLGQADSPNSTIIFPHIRPAGITFLIVFYSKVTVNKAKGHST